MDDKEKMEALKLALTNEEKEREFYLLHASRTSDPVGKAMFESIAEDETEHYRRLLDLHGKLEERKKWPEEFSTELSSSNIREVFDKIIKDVTGLPEADEDDVEAVKVALEFEEKGERLYADLADAAAGEAEKRFFSLLSSMEREHRLSLQDTLEYYEDPKGWLERKGGRLLDGA